MTIDRTLIEVFIALGEGGVASVPKVLGEHATATEELLHSSRPWDSIGNRLDQVRLCHLIKGLVLYSQASGWSGGSVSPVIHLYRGFVERFPEAELALNRWIVENRRNPYEPFGSLWFDDASSVREREQLWAQLRRKRELEQARREEVRRERVAADATAKLPNAVRRGDLAAISALIAKGADWHARDASGSSLLEIAEAAGRRHVVEYFRNLASQGTAPRRDDPRTPIDEISELSVERTMEPQLSVGIDSAGLTEGAGTIGICQAMYFRDELRRARAGALQNAEAFIGVCQALEQLARFLGSNGTGLGGHRQALVDFVFRYDNAFQNDQSAVASFQRLYSLLTEARNSAAHEGAYARNATRHAVEIATLVENALQREMSLVEHFMVADPVCTDLWEPVSHIRQRMLRNSFSFLPVRPSQDGPWRLAGDSDVALFLRGAASNGERARRMALTLAEAIDAGLKVRDARLVFTDDKVIDVIDKVADGLLLVVSRSEPTRLLGILTAFDLL